jgi:glycerate 2-kinase
MLQQWLADNGRYLLCIGKAAVSSAQAILPLVSCKDHFVLSPARVANNSSNIHFGSHPIPDRLSLNAGLDLLQWLKTIPQNDNLLVILSGGASALMVAPAYGISLESKMRVNDLLIRSGASIQEINAVRKHISEIKGGQLAKAVSHLNCLVLVLSDVIGNDLATIGSGPFYPDNTTFIAACDILKRYQLWEKVPGEVKSVLEQGIQGKIAETPKPGSGIEIPHYIIASNDIARKSATAKARELGYQADDFTTPVSGPVEEVASRILSLVNDIPPVSAVVLGGEITVRVDGSGTGGRNQHLALLMTEPIAGSKILFAAAGTDGIDGNSPAAGAWTDGTTLERSRIAGVDLEKALREFDSYNFFHPLDQNISTGVTGTNVMDLYIALKQ